jgi:RNA polymerase sigma factor (sigma-70 family)
MDDARVTAGLTDGELLGRYVAGSDDASFRDLVIRHGPSVLRACRRILRDPHQVEDAFQATFLILVRKAPTLRDPEALGSWLRGVASRVALRAGRDAARRRQHETRRAAMRPTAEAPDPSWDDLGRAVREELDRLPRVYRAPLELCYLKFLSHEEAAAELGWPLGTLKVRLVRGRRRLRERLDRRGLALGLAILLLLRPLRVKPALSGALVDSTVEAMIRGLTSRDVPADPRHARARRLALRSLEPRHRWFWPLVVILGITLVAARGVTLYGQSRSEADEFGAALPANLTNVLYAGCR